MLLLAGVVELAQPVCVSMGALTQKLAAHMRVRACVHVRVSDATDCAHDTENVGEGWAVARRT